MFAPDTPVLQTMYDGVLLLVQIVSLKEVEGFIIPGLLELDPGWGPEVGTGACDTSGGELEYAVKDVNCAGERDSDGSTESVITGCCEHDMSVVESGCCSGDRHLSGLL